MRRITIAPRIPALSTVCRLMVLLIPFVLPALAMDRPVPPPGMRLAWGDEFNRDGAPDPTKWTFEKGFVRNNELQWYQPANARVKGGCLVIEARREQVPNPDYQAGSKDWRRSRPVAAYTSASVTSNGCFQWTYGRLEVRARLDVQQGMWPAIWTLGVRHPWPHNGEIDVMEFYRTKGDPIILANACWGGEKKGQAIWNTKRIPFARFTDQDKDWARKFHTWRMDWDENEVRLLLDDELLNTIDVVKSANPDGFQPFRQPHFLLLNLAIGSNGGDPSPSTFPARYEIDWVRVYQPIRAPRQAR